MIFSKKKNAVEYSVFCANENLLEQLFCAHEPFGADSDDVL